MEETMGATVAFTDLEGFAGTSFPNVSGLEAFEVCERNTRVCHSLLPTLTVAVLCELLYKESH